MWCAKRSICCGRRLRTAALNSRKSWRGRRRPPPITIREYAPAVFPGGVVRAGLGCRASRQNGVRPGETLEVYATGLGRGPFSGLEARINNTPAEVLYAGLLPSFVGLNQVNLRVDSETPPS